MESGQGRQGRRVKGSEPRISPVPTGRVGRLWNLGAMASRMAVGGLAEGARRIAREGRDSVPPLLNVANARVLADRLSRLRGAAMKLGQMLSMEGDNLLPKDFADALSRLRADADVMPIEQVDAVMQRAYGASWRTRFAAFEDVPMASASIGQVHRARTLDGHDVVLKIQYPGVAESIESDVDNLAALLGVARYLPTKLNLGNVVCELKRQLREEADYVREAHNADRFAQMVADLAGVRVPPVHLSLCTERTLVMELVQAPPLFDWAETHAPQALRDDLARRLITLTVRELFDFGLAQTDPNFANYLYQPDTDEIVLLDFGATQPVSDQVAAAYRGLLRAALEDDAVAMRRAMLAAGYLSERAAEEAQAFLTGVVLTCAEMLRRPGIYDFAASNLLDRVKALVRPAIRHKLEMEALPAHLMFFQRKIAGTYLMCRRLGARVDCHALCSDLLAQTDRDARSA